MDKDSYVLVSREGVIYKAKIEALSSIVVTKDEREDFLNYLDELSASLDSLTSSFDTVFYTTTEMKQEFVSKEELSASLWNGTYVTKAEAVLKAQTIKEKAELNDWHNHVLTASAAPAIIKGYDDATRDKDGIMATNGKSAHGHKNPNVNNLIDEKVISIL